MKPLLWTDSLLFPSLGALPCSDILIHPLPANSQRSFWQALSMLLTCLWSIVRRVLIILIALLTPLDDTPPLKKKNPALWKKALASLVQLSLAKYKARLPAPVLVRGAFWNNLISTRFISGNNDYLEIPNSQRTWQCETVPLRLHFSWAAKFPL